MSPVAVASPKPRKEPFRFSEGGSTLKNHLRSPPTHHHHPRKSQNRVIKRYQKSVFLIKTHFFFSFEERIYFVKPAPGWRKTCDMLSNKLTIPCFGHIHLIIITAYHPWYWGILLENVVFTVHERITFCIYINWTCLYYTSYSFLFSF